MSNGNGRTAATAAPFRVESQGAVPTTEAERPTHALVEMEMIGKLARLLSRIALDGQEAGELVMALQKSPVTRIAESDLIAPSPPESRGIAKE